MHIIVVVTLRSPQRGQAFNSLFEMQEPRPQLISNVFLT